MSLFMNQILPQGNTNVNTRRLFTYKYLKGQISEVMNKYETRRIALSELVANLGRGGIALVSSKTGIDPSYVSRMLYSPEKSGAKNIGEELADKLTAAFPDWMSYRSPDLAPESNNGAREKITQFPVNHTLESTIERLVGYLKCVPEHRRKAVGGILESLALHPDDHLGCVVSLKSLLSSNEGRADETATGTNNAPR